MQDLLNKINENKRFVGAGALLILFIIVLAVSGSKSDKKTDVAKDGTEIVKDGTEVAKDTQNTEKKDDATQAKEDFSFDEKFENDENKDLTDLFSKYYKAYTDNDTKELEKIAVPVSDNEKSYIGVLSKYYEEISNITYYSKKGLTDGAYFVSTSYDIKFKDVKTTAPALDFFYVQTNDKGELYIDNLYSVYNLSFMESTVDSDVYAVIQQYMQQQDFASLQSDIDKKYNEALSADKDLEKMVKTTLVSAIKDWASTITPVENNTEADTEKETETESESKTEEKDDKKDEENKDTEADNKEPETEKKDDNTDKEEVSYVKTKDIVRVRKSASTDSEMLGTLTKGVKLKKLGVEGEWTKVEYDGGKGYIKSEFLKDVKKKSGSKSEESKKNDDSDSSNSDSDTTYVKTKDIVRVRKSASADSEMLGTLTKGVKLKKLGEEGEWTKVEYDGGKAYIKSEFLKKVKK